jgi:cytochrome d ubiquinol oxidase subunit II
MVYSVFLPAFYIPVLLMLFGLIFRGVAFEFRYRGAKAFWDGAFCVGSVIAAFVNWLTTSGSAAGPLRSRR